jgi:membrane protease YdiL (CAAX protease family)
MLGSTLFSDPLHGNGVSLRKKIFLSPFICVIGPVFEELLFRGGLQDLLKVHLNSFYVKVGFSHSAAKLASRITSIFFSSVIFGLFHFTNALVFWCNPIIFVPQVVATTVMGLLFGLAKELTGKLHLPVGMHIGNNTLAWTAVIKSSL